MVVFFRIVSCSSSVARPHVRKRDTRNAHRFISHVEYEARQLLLQTRLCHRENPYRGTTTANVGLPKLTKPPHGTHHSLYNTHIEVICLTTMIEGDIFSSVQSLPPAYSLLLSCRPFRSIRLESTNAICFCTACTPPTSIVPLSQLHVLQCLSLMLKPSLLQSNLSPPFAIISLPERGQRQPSVT